MRSSFFTGICCLIMTACIGGSTVGWQDLDYVAVRAAEFTSDLEDSLINPAGNPVAEHGQLSVQDGQLVDKDGHSVQLKGMSSFWINWSTGGKYVNRNVIRSLAQDWGVSLYRIAVGVAPDDGSGYVQNSRRMRQMVSEVVDECIRQGIYIIIDWHAHDEALMHPQHAAAFFKGVAETWGHYPNIIYELWNEPVRADWNTQIKPFSQRLIDDVIRPVDHNNIIIIGTRQWAQRVDEAAANPLEGDNLIYSLHFYSGTHQAWLRQRAEQAMSAGIALFVTEWGLSTADGGEGTYDIHSEEGQRWLDWMDEHRLSWANWSIADKFEASAALRPNAPVSGQWSDNHLTPSGLFIKNALGE